MHNSNKQISHAVTLVLWSQKAMPSKGNADIEILVVVRDKKQKVYPGFTSLPGGKLDKDECLYQDDDFKKFYQHGILPGLMREIEEELAFNIKEVSLKTNNEFRYLGRSTTPEFWPQRFMNYYIGLEIPDDKWPSFASSSEEHFWQGRINLETLLMQDMNGEHLMVPPTRNLFHQFKDTVLQDGTLDQKSWNNNHPEDCVPLLEFQYGLPMALPLSPTFPPANRTNALLLKCDAAGINHILIDPSPLNDDELNKIFKTFSGISIKEILITHHHPDHHHLALELVQRWDTQILMSEQTFKNINKDFGENYLKPFREKIRFLKEGDTIGQFHGRPCQVWHVPGHDNGQLAVIDSKKRFAFVSDLIQTIGTVVIGGEEGDMGDYYNSLKRCISFGPYAVYPSHGLPMGGVAQLEKTLEHRQEREKQILNLCLAGKNDQQILEGIYVDLPVELHYYALKTIEAHKNKLRKEGKI